MKPNSTPSAELIEARRRLWTSIPSALREYTMKRWYLEEMPADADPGKYAHVIVIVACMLGRSDIIVELAALGEWVTDHGLWSWLADGPDPEDFEALKWTSDRVGVARCMLSQGGSIHGRATERCAVEQDGETREELDPLFYALDYHQWALAEFLLANGANPFSSNGFSATRIVEHGRRELYGLLLAATSRQALRNEIRLCMAASSGDEAAVTELLELGVDTDAKRFFAGWPLFLAIREGHLGIARRLVEDDADVRTHREKICRVVFANSRLDFIEWLGEREYRFEANAIVDDEDLLDDVIGEAVECGQVGSLEWLAANGAKFALEDRAYHGREADPAIVAWIERWVAANPQAEWSRGRERKRRCWWK